MQELAEVSLWWSSLVQGTADGISYLQCALLFVAVVRFRALHTVPYTRGSYRLVRTLQQNPATEDFVYLRRAKRQPADANPYALQVTLAWCVQRRCQPSCGRCRCTVFSMADDHHCMNVHSDLLGV